MAGTNYKISELPAVTTLDGNNVLPVVDLVASSTKKATVQQVLNFVTGSTINNLSVTAGSFSNLNSTTLTSSNASITTLSASVISASSYINLPNLPAGGTNGSIQYNVGGFNTGDSSKLVLDYTNNFFGVGVNPPLARFHAKASSGEIARLETTVLRGNGTNYLSFHDPVGIKGYVGYGGTVNDHLNISNAVGNADITLITSGSDGNLERMRITSVGNVGIGTSNPLARLQSTTAVFPGGSTPVVSSVSSASLYLNNWDDLYGMMFGVSGSGTGWIQQQRRDSNIQYPLLLNPLGGNVGIGISNPVARLDVDSAANAWARWRSSSTAGSFMSFVKGGTSTNIGYIGTDAGGILGGGSGDHFGIRSEYDLLLMAGSAERARITSAGNVGIGTSSPSTALHVVGETRAGNFSDNNGAYNVNLGSNNLEGRGLVVGYSGGSYGGIGYNIRHTTTGGTYISPQADTSNYIQFSQGFQFLGDAGTTAGRTTNFAELMRITNAGNVGIGTTSPSFQLQLNSDSAAKPSTNTWTISSDIRVKENIQNYSKGLEVITQLNPVTYDYNGKAGFNSEIKNNIGLIAQDIKDILPESINTYKTKLNPEDTEDTELYNFNSHALTYVMINSIKQLLEEVNALKSEIQILKSGSL
jgi:hypothetical protein